MSDPSLQQIVRQIEAVNQEMKNMALDRSELFKAARQQGYDVKVLRRVISERAKSQAEREEAEQLFRTYWEGVQLVRQAAEAEA